MSVNISRPVGLPAPPPVLASPTSARFQRLADRARPKPHLFANLHGRPAGFVELGRAGDQERCHPHARPQHLIGSVALALRSPPDPACGWRVVVTLTCVAPVARLPTLIRPSRIRDLRDEVLEWGTWA